MSAYAVGGSQNENCRILCKGPLQKKRVMK